MYAPNRKHLYYLGDDVTFRGSFKVDGEDQIPDDGSCLATIVKRGTANPIVNGAAGEIAGAQLRYKFSDMPVGQYAIFLTASFSNGADQRTGVIEFVVKNKEAN